MASRTHKVEMYELTTITIKIFHQVQQTYLRNLSELQVRSQIELLKTRKLGIEKVIYFDTGKPRIISRRTLCECSFRNCALHNMLCYFGMDNPGLEI